MDPWPSLPLFAPLALDQVWDLLSSREENLPRGRIQRGEDKLAWYEQRLLQAQESLLTNVVSARRKVFELLDPVVRNGQLTRRWLIDILYPPPLTPYPDRLREWREENFLLYDQNEEPEPQSTAAILIQRELDARKRKLPHPRSNPRSFFCWRQDAPELQPYPYELPYVSVDSTLERPIYHLRPEQSPSPSILATPWKGVSWNDETWLIYDEGAIRWVGEPDEDMLRHWLSVQELEQLSAPGRADSSESRARQALRFLASRLIHV